MNGCMYVRRGEVWCVDPFWAGGKPHTGGRGRQHNAPTHRVGDDDEGPGDEGGEEEGGEEEADEEGHAEEEDQEGQRALRVEDAGFVGGREPARLDELAQEAVLLPPARVQERLRVGEHAGRPLVHRRVEVHARAGPAPQHHLDVGHVRVGAPRVAHLPRGDLPRVAVVRDGQVVDQGRLPRLAERVEAGGEARDAVVGVGVGLGLVR